MAVNITKSDIRKAVMAMKTRTEKAVLFNLKRIGEEFIINARNNETYLDQTGNLRSSIGYVIMRNGLQYHAGKWITVKQGRKGIVVAKSVIAKLSKKYPTGLVLICVAGMDYAAAVEAKGFDVITNSAAIAKKDLKHAMQRISRKIK